MKTPLLVIGPNGDDTYFVGDLEAGKALVAQDRWIFEGVSPKVSDNGHYFVHLCDDEEGNQIAEWGGGPTAEIAWRYAIGAACGPIDAEYDEAALITSLRLVTGGGGKAD